MPAFICVTCGVQQGETDSPPGHCGICEDERQYIGKGGQRWTTREEMRAGFQNRIEEIEPDLTGVGTVPAFALAPRALLVKTSAGNVLWDCISLLDEATVEAVRERGGISALAVSHPHLAGSIVDWSRAFGGAPIYWHGDNRGWVARPDPAYVFWEGESQPLVGGLELVRCGGHFEGSAVLHWAHGAGGRGALLTGDTIQVAQDRRYVGFMHSYPNMIPLNRHAVERIVGAVEPLVFDRLYGGWWDSIVASQAKSAVKRSAQRYIQAIQS